MWLAQTQAPGVPDPSSLKDLPTPVAVLLLCLIGLLACLFYFGGALRDRITKKPPDPAPPSLSSPAAPVAAPALDRAAEVTDRYTAHLLAQIAELKTRVDELEQDNRRLHEELDRWRMSAFRAPPRHRYRDE